jgi:hypothetical protein
MLLFVVVALVAFIFLCIQWQPIEMNPTSELPESGCSGNDNRCGT